jgi:periplasmic protein TonB
MRTCTILFSIAAHAVVVFAVFVVSVTATEMLPAARRAIDVVVVHGQLPAPPPPSLARTRRTEAAVPGPNAVPLVAPDGFTPERAQPAIDDLPAPDAVIGAGLAPATAVIDAPPQAAPPPEPREAIHVGGDIRPPVKLRYVAPVYPRIALEARLEAVVILEAVIADDGAVDAVKVLRGHPLLNQAAIDAVKQWQFTPTLLNGQPVPVVMTVTVSFSLNM